MDDELPGLAYLRTICAELPNVEVVKLFSDPLKFVAEAPQLDFDFFVSDINMPGLSGVELARRFKNKPVIFTTAYKEFAAEAFELEAVDYIVKPVRKERFEKAIHKIRQLKLITPPAQAPIVLNSSKGKLLLDRATIAIVRSSYIDRRDKIVVLRSGEELLLKNISFQQIEELLPDHAFCRINKKEIIAVALVKYYTHETVSVEIKGNTINLALSPRYKTALKLLGAN